MSCNCGAWSFRSYITLSNFGPNKYCAFFFILSGIHMLKYWCQIWPKHNFMHQIESNSMEKLFNTLKLVLLPLK